MFKVRFYNSILFREQDFLCTSCGLSIMYTWSVKDLYVLVNSFFFTLVRVLGCKVLRIIQDPKFHLGTRVCIPVVDILYTYYIIYIYIRIYTCMYHVLVTTRL